MIFRPLHRRSPFFAFTAWLCLVLQLGLFTAAGWHFHGPTGHGFGSCGGAVGACVEGEACCGEGECECREHSRGCDSGHSACTKHTGGHHRGDPSKAPRDGRDPEGCCICKAIFVLGHATLIVPVAVVVVPAGTIAPLSVYEQVHAPAWQRRQWSRGPPMTGS